MEPKLHKELFQNTVYLLLFFLVVFISTASVNSLNPKTLSEVDGNISQKEAVKGLSTFDGKAIKFEKIFGIYNGIKFENFERDGGFLSRMIISKTKVYDVEQNIVKIVNASNSTKKLKVIFRADPSFQQQYTFWTLVNGYYTPLVFDQYGYDENTITLDPNSENMTGIRIYSKDSSLVQNLGVEMEVIEV